MKNQSRCNETHAVASQPKNCFRFKVNSFRSFISLVIISLAITACGANNDDATSAAESRSGSDRNVGASATVANSGPVPLVMSLKMNMTSLTTDSQTDRFIVKYKTDTAERKYSSAVQARLDRLANSLPARARHSRRLSADADLVTSERQLSIAETEVFMRAIAADPNVQYIEPDVIMSSGSTPNDPYFGSQWGLLSNQDPGQLSAGIRAERAWNIATGAGVTIALLDNGLTSHSDLKSNILPGGVDFTYLPSPGDGTNPGRTDPNSRCSVTWHGTHVAGILAAQSNNNIGIVGVAPSSKLLSVRVLNECGNGTLVSVANAVIWAAGGAVPGWPINQHPARVINASLGGRGQCSQFYQDAIDTANELGARVVVSAMNDNIDASNSQPANCRGVIAVGNTQRDGSRGYLSNFGPTVDISAPGTDILSTYNDGASSVGSETYTYMSGTSMAAPMVSGVVALIQSVAPKPLSLAEIRTLLSQHAQPFPKQPDQPMGPGILDAAAVVTAAKFGEIPAAADFQCSQSISEMRVTCFDRSSARGALSIASWAWNFGANSSVDIVRTQSANPTYDYEYPGTYSITLQTTDKGGYVSRVARPFTVIAPESTDLSFDQNVEIPSVANVPRLFRLDVPAGASTLRVNISNRSTLESGMMYVKAGSPTTVNAACSSRFASGAGAQCIIKKPVGGAYYVTVIPNTNLDGSVIYATYTI